jgi:hypothetical protein
MIGRAIATFEATASNQISLSIGDIVRVHQMTPGKLYFSPYQNLNYLHQAAGGKASWKGADKNILAGSPAITSK